MPTPNPEHVSAKLQEVAAGIQNGRTRWVVCVYCLENGQTMTEAGLLVPGGAEGSVVTLLRNGADPAELARCVAEVAEKTAANERRRLGLSF